MRNASLFRKGVALLSVLDAVPNWVRANLLKKNDDMQADNYSETITADHDVDHPSKANLITSKAAEIDGIQYHYPILDIDYEAKLIPSTSPGHYHLYLDKAVTWESYNRLLTALAECGIIQAGFANASKQRGYSAVRLPHVKKQEKKKAEDMSQFSLKSFQQLLNIKGEMK